MRSGLSQRPFSRYVRVRPDVSGFKCRSLGAGLLLLAAAACGDLPTEAPDARSTRAAAQPELSLARQGRSEFVCFTSERTPGAQYRYRYGRDFLHFPRTELSASGAKRTYRYRRYDAAGEPVVVANCLIPATEAARVRTNRHFHMPDGAGRTGHRLLGGGAVAIEGLLVEACQNGEVWPDCETEGSSGGNTTPVYSPPAYGGGNPGGGTGGGGGTGSTTEGDDPDPGEPCNTGNAQVDSEAAQAGFDYLWSNSNADAPDQEDRRERGGFLVNTPNGLVFEPFPSTWASGPCSITPPPDAVPPAGTVAVVHTHPWTVGEKQTSCGPSLVLPNGTQLYQNYPGTFTADDQNTLAVFGRRLGGQTLKGYILDADGIREFTSASVRPTSYGRCAY